MEGNQMKMREALVAMVEAETEGSMDRDDLCGRCFEKMWDSCKHDGSCWVDKVINALSEPPRNCDVGTPYEQANRMRQFCAKQKRNGIINCGYCPIKHEYQRDCTLSWAQMPYEAKEGDAK